MKPEITTRGTKVFKSKVSSGCSSSIATSEFVVVILTSNIFPYRSALAKINKVAEYTYLAI